MSPICLKCILIFTAFFPSFYDIYHLFLWLSINQSLSYLFFTNFIFSYLLHFLFILPLLWLLSKYNLWSYSLFLINWFLIDISYVYLNVSFLFSFSSQYLHLNFSPFFILICFILNRDTQPQASFCKIH